MSVFFFLLILIHISPTKIADFFNLNGILLFDSRNDILPS